MIRPTQYLSVTVALLGSGVTSGACMGRAHSLPDTIGLQIESLSRLPVRVEVLSSPPGVWLDSASSADPQAQLVVRTPALMRVADSVRRLDVMVLGPGAVRLGFVGADSAQKQTRAIWGRDITLRRGVDGQFRPVAKVIPLYP